MGVVCIKRSLYYLVCNIQGCNCKTQSYEKLTELVDKAEAVGWKRPNPNKGGVWLCSIHAGTQQEALVPKKKGC